jgi:hypothetical protein
MCINAGGFLREEGYLQPFHLNDFDWGSKQFKSAAGISLAWRAKYWRIWGAAFQGLV